MPLSQWPLAGDTGLWGVTGLVRPRCYVPWPSIRSRASQKTVKSFMWSKRLVTCQDQLQSCAAALTTLFGAAACFPAFTFSFLSSSSSSSYFCWAFSCSPVLSRSTVSWHCCMRSTLYFFFHTSFFLFLCFFLGFQSGSAVCFAPVQCVVHRFRHCTHTFIIVPSLLLSRVWL